MKFKFNCLLLLLFILNGFYSAFANTILINDSIANYPLTDEVLLIKDSSLNLKLEDVLAKQNILFEKRTIKNLNFGYSKAKYWFKISIKNNTLITQDLIYSVAFPSLNKISFFELDSNNHLIKEVETGQLYKYNTRAINHQDFLFDFKLKPFEKKTIIISAYNNGDSMYLPMNIFKNKEYHQLNYYVIFAYGIYFGILIIILIFNLFYIITIKEKIYLYYLFYVLFTSLFFISLDGILQKLFSPNLIWWNEHSLVLYLDIAVIFLYSFSQSFLKLKSRTPFIHKIFNGGKIFVFILFILSFTNYPLLLFPNAAISALIPISFVFILSISIFLTIKRYELAKYFLYAFSITFVGVAIHILRDFAILPQNYLTANILRFCFLIEVIILFFAILERIKIAQQKANAQIENQKIKLQETNIELEKLSIVASRTDNSIAIFNNSGQIEWCNRQFEEIHLNGCAQLLKNNEGHIQDIFASLEIEKHLKACTEQKETIIFEHKLWISKEKNLFTQVTITPLVDDNGNIEKIISIESDITKLKEYEVELVEARDKAQESDQLKSTFLANMSHEIRTPMNAIMGFTKMLNRPNLLEAKRKKYIKIIDKSTSDLIRLVDDIMDVSKIESGQMNVIKRTFNVNEFINEIFSMYHLERKRMDKEDIEFTLNNTVEKEDLTIESDPERIKQVIFNLLNNAFKFTESGYVELGVMNKNTGSLMFYVKDSGIGIEKDKQDLIFNRFSKFADTQTKLYRGAGLGLTICAKILELLEGNLWLSSFPGQGSVFFFSVPMVQIKGEYLNRPDEKEFDLISQIDWSDYYLLIAEDNQENYELIRELLEKTDINITWVKNGQEAVDMASRTSFDLILMDIQMPIMNGYEATREIKKFSNVPIISITAYAQKGEAEKSTKAGCDAYIAKPIDHGKLFLNLKKFLKPRN